MPTTLHKSIFSYRKSRVIPLWRARRPLGKKTKYILVVAETKEGIEKSTHVDRRDYEAAMDTYIPI